MKQKQNQGHRRTGKLVVAKEEGVGRGEKRNFEVSRWKLEYREKIKNKPLHREPYSMFSDKPLMEKNILFN